MSDISIRECCLALQFAITYRYLGFPVLLPGRWILVTEPLEVLGEDWISGHLVLGRPEQLAFTEQARKTIVEAINPLPPAEFPPEISSRECCKALNFAGDLEYTYQGMTLIATDLSVRHRQWWCSNHRLNITEQRLLTQAARSALHFEQHLSTVSEAEQNERRRRHREFCEATAETAQILSGELFP